MDVSPSFRAPDPTLEALPSDGPDPRGMRSWAIDHFGSAEPPSDVLGDFLSSIMGGPNADRW